MLNNTTLKDHITTKNLLVKFNLLSVNQLAASIKLVEAWKSIHIPNYPVQMGKNNMNRPESSRVLRENSIQLWKEDAQSKLGKEFFCRNTAKLWNNTSPEIKNARNTSFAKKGNHKILQNIAYLIITIYYFFIHSHYKSIVFI